ncbi:MAG: LacI family DNA-binding transcriptional regulator [Sphaerochaeta sp.]|uniref:LacI family DNA-binding transcriptional regulator n=1 Tax=unclassified Sphaerochaeta TaxID=2637943 RepID=UPI0025F5FCAE|nr:LacI family DNA-binding transcriptional regulator [Sphaerochaeta sp. UBA5836]
MAVTIRDIAKKAGVSRGTVDRVLHNRKGVNEEVASRVRTIANELGFIPNLAGKALATRKQPLRIGCLLPSIGNPFFSDVIAGFRQAERELADFGVSVDIMEVKSFDRSVHLDAIETLQSKRYDGLCITTINVEPVIAAIDKITEAGTTVVTVNTDISDTHRLCYVGPDYYLGGTTASGLLSLVCKQIEQKILIVTGSFNIKGHQERIRGFLEGLTERKMPHTIVDVIESLDDNDKAYERTLSCLKMNPETNCLYLTAAGVQGACKAVQELGKAGIIRILCFDDIPTTKTLIKEGVITFTICQEPQRQGYDAIQKLFFHLMNQQEPVVDTITRTIIKIRENLDD